MFLSSLPAILHRQRFHPAELKTAVDFPLHSPRSILWLLNNFSVPCFCVSFKTPTRRRRARRKQHDNLLSILSWNGPELLVLLSLKLR